MAYVLWTRLLRHSPSNPRWPDRDRFVLSAGHGSTLLYSRLHLTGYDLSLEQTERFRQWGSATPGHPASSAELTGSSRAIYLFGGGGS
jgi:transketolase